MGKLIRNGIEYGGGNGTDIFEVTQAEYDALEQAGTLVHNALYVITDAPNLNATASDIEYSSGVSVADKLDDLEDNKTQVKVAKATMTTNATGFCSLNLGGTNVIILSAWSSTGDVLIIPFSASSASEYGTSLWWFRVHNDSMQVRTNFTFDMYYSYIET